MVCLSTFSQKDTSQVFGRVSNTLNDQNDLILTMI